MSPFRARNRIAAGFAIFVVLLIRSDHADRLTAAVDDFQSADLAPRLALTADSSLGILPAQSLYWHIYEYPTRAAADAARGERGTTADVFGRHWLYTIAEETWRPAAGEKTAVIGPLQVASNTPYTARYLEALFRPDDPQPTGEGHRHPGPEAWYVVSGAQCLETPNGLIMAKAGQGAMVPDGWPMAISNVGPETRRALVLILHRTAEPYSMRIDDPRSPGAPHSHWKPQGLCPR
jgi:hypothetical protein